MPTSLLKVQGQRIVNPAGDSKAVDALAVSFDPSGTALPNETEMQGVTTKLAEHSALSLRTGWLSGCLITVNAGNPALIDISAGVVWVVDHSVQPFVPVEVPFAGVVGVAITSILTTNSTALAINVSGNLIQTPNGLYADGVTDSIAHIGTVLHTDNLTITREINTPRPCWNTNAFDTFAREVFGPANIEGNIYSGNIAGDLSMDRSAGKTYVKDGNVRINPASPDIFIDSAALLVDVLKAYRDPADNNLAIPIEPTTKFVDPTQWENGSGLQSTGNNNWTVQLVYSYPNLFTTVLYGQETFGNKADALAYAQLGAPRNIDYGGLNRLILRAYLVVKGNASDLTDINEAEFVVAADSKSSGGGGGGTSQTLNNVLGTDPNALAQIFNVQSDDARYNVRTVAPGDRQGTAALTTTNSVDATIEITANDVETTLTCLIRITSGGIRYRCDYVVQVYRSGAGAIAIIDEFHTRKSPPAGVTVSAVISADAILIRVLNSTGSNIETWTSISALDEDCS